MEARGSTALSQDITRKRSGAADCKRRGKIRQIETAGMRQVWRKGRSTPRGLFETTGGNLAMSDAPQGTAPREIEEYDIRIWFMKTDLDQARDTFRVVEGIIQTREQFQPKRKRRSDAGKSRDDGQETLVNLKEIGK
jgi:hypothetical protein